MSYFLYIINFVHFSVKVATRQCCMYAIKWLLTSNILHVYTCRWGSTQLFTKRRSKYLGSQQHWLHRLRAVIWLPCFMKTTKNPTKYNFKWFNKICWPCGQRHIEEHLGKMADTENRNQLHSKKHTKQKTHTTLTLNKHV